MTDRGTQDKIALEAICKSIRKDDPKYWGGDFLQKEDIIIKEMYLAYCNSVAEENSLIQLQERLAWLEYRLSNG